jgi:hypothetical protein
MARKSGVTSDGAVAVNLEAVERRRHLRRVLVVEVGPASDGVAADVGVRHARCLRRASHPPLILVESQPRTHRPRAVHVVPELRRQKSLRDTESSCQARAFQEKDQRRPCVPSLCRRLGWHR